MAGRSGNGKSFSEAGRGHPTAWGGVRSGPGDDHQVAPFRGDAGSGAPGSRPPTPPSPHLDPVQQVAAAVDGSGEAPGGGRHRGLCRPRSQGLLLRRQLFGLGRRLGVGGRWGLRGARAPQAVRQLHPECQPQPQPETPDPARAERRQAGALVGPAPSAAPGPAPGVRGPGHHG